MASKHSMFTKLSTGAIIIIVKANIPRRGEVMVATWNVMVFTVNLCILLNIYILTIVLNNYYDFIFCIASRPAVSSRWVTPIRFIALSTMFIEKDFHTQCL